MKARTGASATNFRCRSPLASSSRTTPKIAMSAPATRAAMSSCLAIDAGSFLCSGNANARLDPQLAEADVRVHSQPRRARPGCTGLLPVVVGPAARLVESGCFPPRDVRGARHADVRRDEHLGLAEPELQMHAVVAGPELRIAEVEQQMADTELVVAAQVVGRRGPVDPLTGAPADVD